MNTAMIRYILFWVLRIEGAFMLLPCVIALIYGERQGFVYLVLGLICLLIGQLAVKKRPGNAEIYAKDGMIAVSLAWVLIGVVGAIPFLVTREIPHIVDALFETVSGFTTTGASILTDIESLSHASLFWRSFTHWIGGMGVLVFLLMLIPVRSGSRMNLMRAESPGYNVSKFVPRVRETAMILYKIYIIMTVAEAVILIASRMPWFDAVCLSFGTAGTGGFAVLNSGCASYTAFQQWVLTIFMILFGVNFNAYFLLTAKRAKAAFRISEVRAYFLIIVASALLIVTNTYRIYQTMGDAVRHSFFQVGSIMTTTGFSTTDFNLWPSFSKFLLVILMCIGACAGSTGGGMKVSRLLIVIRAGFRKLSTIINPHRISRVQIDGESVDEEQVNTVTIFLGIYFLIFALSILIVSIDNFSLETNFTAVAATLNNIGPGLDAVGPTSNYAAYGILSKIVLIFDMLAGRLELFPVLILFYPEAWRKRS